MEDSIFEKIYKTVLKIPKGKVATYGAVATAVGNPRLARVVGYALHQNPYFGIVPCHRVVNRLGKTATSFSFGGGDKQREMLESEGVRFDRDGKIDLKIYGYYFNEQKIEND